MSKTRPSRKPRKNPTLPGEPPQPEWSATFRKCYLDQPPRTSFEDLRLLLTSHAHDEDDVGKVGSAALIMEAVGHIARLEELGRETLAILHDSAKYPQLKLCPHQEERLTRVSNRARGWDQ